MKYGHGTWFCVMENRHLWVTVMYLIKLKPMWPLIYSKVRVDDWKVDIAQILIMHKLVLFQKETTSCRVDYYYFLNIERFSFILNIIFLILNMLV